MTAPRSQGARSGADLSTRARRIGLSEDERILFERACDADADLRISHQVGCDFDQIAHVSAGDEELVARVVERTLASSRRGRQSRRLAWSLGAAAALFTTVAAAAWWRGGSSAATKTQSLSPVVALSAEAPAAGPDQAALPPAEEHAVPTSPTASERAVARSSTRSAARVGRHAGSAGTEGIAQADGDTAAAWFRRANAARHAGSLSAATSLYTKLQERFPDSEEARVSHVSLGRLLLESGRPLEAERQFSSYLGASGRELAEEAWVGRAESLARLGRNVDERRSWLKLLQEFPASVYAERAKQRVDELDALGP